MQVSQLQREREQEARLCAAQARRALQLEAELQQVGGERGSLLTQLDRLRKDQQERLLQQQRALSTVGGATQQYHHQIKQTQDLLQVGVRGERGPFVEVGVFI